MAAKKFYGVKKGKITGVFTSWDECKKSVDGFPGAEYKGFATYDEVCAYLGIVPSKQQSVTGEQDKLGANIKPVGNVSEVNAGDMGNEENNDSLLTYVDGSYDDSIKKYAFGCVFILPDGKIYTEYGNGDNPQSLQHRNVTGEMLGAMYAVKTAMMNGFGAVEICYDYQGIEKWVTGEWRSKTELTQKYTAAMREWSRSIRITFTKVAAHSNIKYNELADEMAKKGLTEGNGVPKVRKLEEMEYYGTDSTQ
ncbi:MAG: ribonuclease H family protein [Eubacterium sp.]|nr:ribonuclease H family protein [Eubacterium sp.]